MKFHMLMLLNEWMMFVLMQMQVQSASLTLECYSPSPLIEISSRDLNDLSFFHKMWGKLHVNSPLFPMLHLVHYGYSTLPCGT